MGGSSQLQTLASGSRWLLRVTAPGLGHEVVSPGRHWPRTLGSSSWHRPYLGCRVSPLATTDLGHGVAPPSRSFAIAAWHSGPLSLTSDVGWLSAVLSAPARCRRLCLDIKTTSYTWKVNLNNHNAKFSSFYKCKIMQLNNTIISL